MEASLHSNVQTRQDIARDIVRDSIISRYGCVRVVYLRAEHGRGLWWTYPWIFNSAPKCCWANRDVVQKKNIVFRNLVWHDLVYSLFLSQFRRLALQACDELKSKYLWNATKGLRWANLLPMKRVRLTSGVCTSTLWPGLSWNIRHWMDGSTLPFVGQAWYTIYIGIVHITRLIPGVCTYLHPVTGDRSGRLLTNPELSLLPPHLPVWWRVHETWFQNNFILRVELTCNNRVILLQWVAVWRIGGARVYANCTAPVSADLTDNSSQLAQTRSNNFVAWGPEWSLPSQLWISVAVCMCRACRSSAGQTRKTALFAARESNYLEPTPVSDGFQFHNLKTQITLATASSSVASLVWNLSL